MEKVVLEANLRKDFSKSARKNLRNNGRVPGVFYSKSEEVLGIDVPEKILKPLVFTAETHLISLQVEGQNEHDCIIKDIQFDPITDKVIHFDLIGLTKGETIELEVPIQFIGSPIGVKDGGIVQQLLHKLQVECLPNDIPQHLEIEVGHLKLGDAIHVSDLSFENITILNSEEAVVIAVTHPKVEKEPEPVEGAEEESAEPEVIGKGKPEEDED
ncbi:MAG: 50S ribosomal protein L25 [Ignavibacteriaceae bacterium]